MVIKAEIEFNAPLNVVWRTFAHLEDWDTWNTACRSCCNISRNETLPVGTYFSFVIRPLVLPLKVQPMIVKCGPGREVVWEGGKMGINASHTWRFHEQNRNVQLLSIERFDGPMVWVGYLLNEPKRLHRLTLHFLKTLRSASEACSS